MSRTNNQYLKIAAQHREFVEKVNFITYIFFIENVLVKNKKYFKEGKLSKSPQRIIFEISTLIN